VAAQLAASQEGLKKTYLVSSSIYPCIFLGSFHQEVPTKCYVHDKYASKEKGNNYM
jgi:hypothetical protein